MVLAGRREDVLASAAAELGGRASYVRCDVCHDDQVDAAVGHAAAQEGVFSLAVNAAGVGSAGSLLRTSTDELTAVVNTNLLGVFRAMQTEARVMAEAGGGSIVNISSIAAVLTHKWMSAYCASKAAVNMLTRCAADELGERGVRVNAVMPGLVDTELASLLVNDADARAEYLRRMPIARIGRSQDVARLVAFLLSDEASWITGQCVAVDGGHTLRQGPDLVSVFRKYLPDAG